MLTNSASAIDSAITELFSSRLNLFAGSYGSGKTEIAVNLALAFASAGETVHLIDLDFIKPCFRTREVRVELEKAGINVIAPTGQLAHADTPIVLPEAAALIQGMGLRGRVIVDLGGDPAGARAISQFADAIKMQAHELFLVVNTRRLMMQNAEQIIGAANQIGEACRLNVSALISNTHLGDETDQALIMEGLQSVIEASVKSGIPLRAVIAPELLRNRLNSTEFNLPLLFLQRRMLTPWEKDGGYSLEEIDHA